jgi:hypothetical protein
VGALETFAFTVLFLLYKKILGGYNVELLKKTPMINSYEKSGGLYQYNFKE